MKCCIVGWGIMHIRSLSATIQTIDTKSCTNLKMRISFKTRLYCQKHKSWYFLLCAFSHFLIFSPKLYGKILFRIFNKNTHTLKEYSVTRVYRFTENGLRWNIIQLLKLFSYITSIKMLEISFRNVSLHYWVHIVQCT